MSRVLTGDRPTGKLHIGHYVGSLKARIAMQDSHEVFIIVADVQALTDNFSCPEKIRENILESTIDNLAIGLNPDKVKFFIQSAIPEIAELTIFFMNLVTHARVLRNPTVKQELKSKNFRNPPFGFVAYPVSQAADILIVRANLVPVGQDQKPMIELARDISKSFNKIYGCNVFPIPIGVYSANKVLVGIDGKFKMSKSLNNAIFFSDSDEIIKEKVFNMYTDPNRIHPTDPGRVEGNPVFIYHDLFNKNVLEVQDLKERYVKGKVSDVEVKHRLFLALTEFIAPIRERRIYFEKNKDIVWDILRTGTSIVKKEAEHTLELVREAIKIDYFK
ncbi:MAG: tryptophan--tRNA ligase [Candidatus Dojkabacteria bacterium]|nr:tryptophan--tRNA ligase [Candidatus Dojkabacteria bacterium]